MSDDASDRVKPWTIKGIPPEARNAAITAAEREKQTLGEWITRAIRAQVQSDHQRERAPAIVGPEARPGADLAEIERIVAMTASLAAAGAPPPKAVARATYSLLRDRLGHMRKPGPTQVANSPTQTASGLTDVADGPTEEA